MAGVGFHFDSHEFDTFSANLRGAPDRVQRKAPKVFEVGINKAKRTLKRMASGHNYLPELSSHVDYDKYGPLNYELGFNKVGQGRLANIAVYGSVNNAPIMGTPADALRVEIPSIMSNLADVGADEMLRGDK